MKTVMVFGTFDVLHPGHKFFLKKARREGSYLVAVVSRDEYVRRWKAHDPIYNQEERVRHLESSRLVDKAVISDHQIGTYGVVDQHKPDIICLGHDQEILLANLEAWLDQQPPDWDKPRIIVLPPWKREFFSSTLRNSVLKENQDRVGVGLGREIIFSLLLLCTTSIWGFSWVIGKLVTTTASLNTIVFWRFLISAASFLPTLFFHQSSTKKQPPSLRAAAKDWRSWVWTLAGAGALTFYNRFFFRGLDTGLAGQGGMIVTTLNPIFTFLFVLLLTRSRPKSYQIIGLLLGLLGGGLLLQPWRFNSAEWGTRSNLLFLWAAMLWAGLTILSRRGQDVWGFFRFNFFLYAAATLLAFPFALQENSLSPPGLEGSFWVLILYLALLAGSLGTGLYFLAVRHLGAQRSSTFTFLVPITALISSVLILGEKLLVSTLLGGSLAILAVFFVNAPAKKKRE